MYVELCRFQRGVFIKRETPFFSKTAFTVFDKAVEKFIKLPEQEVLVTLRHDNHILIRSWTNVKPIISGKERIKNAKR